MASGPPPIALSALSKKNANNLDLGRFWQLYLTGTIREDHVEKFSEKNRVNTAEQKK